MLTRLLTLTLTSTLLTASQGQSAAGVFLFIEGGAYTFNFTAAPAACHSRHATVATIANVEEALRHGLETCKFGWVAEQVAVVPRLTASSKCGNGKTGLVKWNARAEQAFGVFCFTATATPPTFTSSTTTAIAPSLPSSTSPPSYSQTTTTTTPPDWTSHQVPISTSSPALPRHASSSFSSGDALPSHVITSSPTSSFSSSSSFTSAPTHASNQQTQKPTEAPLKAVWMALIVLGIVFIMAAVAGALCYYYKLSNGPCRSQVLQGDDVEAEMWKPTNSRTALHREHDYHDEEEEEKEEEEEGDAKYSSDIMLCVNPSMSGVS
ncbi:lymphatic vessel endothelial hyaluronic receptor 1b isoform X1 [Hippocampus comes]|nr:PREDICTED: lymphatic vessel endothelial hyaluronic acid receptor 1-like isoform X1 [Hippocampus comes]